MPKNYLFSFLQTLLATLLSLIIFAIVSTVVSAVFALSNIIVTVIRPEILWFFGGIFGAVAGVNAARYVCDGVFANYNRRFICVVFVALAVITQGLVLILLPWKWQYLNGIGAFGAAAIGAVAIFWNDAERGQSA